MRQLLLQAMKVLLFTFIFCLLNACSVNEPISQYNIGDGGFLSASPCGPPCFYKIAPGTSSKDDVVALLTNIKIFETCVYFDNTGESGNEGFSCNSNLMFTFRDRKVVSSISFKPTQEITVEEIIKKYGYPDRVLVNGRGLPESPVHTVIILFLDNLKANIILFEQESNIYVLTPKTKVETIGYADDLSYESEIKYSEKWNGYSTYTLHTP